MSKLYPSQYIRALVVINSRVARNFRIVFDPEDGSLFKHLILTGQNGSGKTTILEALAREIHNRFPEQVRLKEEALAKENAEHPYVTALKTFGAIEGQKQLPHLFTLLKSNRDIVIEPVQGPQRENTDLLLSNTDVSASFLQFLVNRKTEQAYALANKDHETSDRIEKWFAGLEEQFRFLFEDPGLTLEFKRQIYEFKFVLSDGRHVGLGELSHGHAGILNLLGNLVIKHEAYRKLHPDVVNVPGIILIDEIENHLHLSLQEKIMPFLTTMFPAFQFIVATHSPAVISSIKNSVVYDLSKSCTVTEDLRGYPYQVLMKAHFGLESEYSIEVTEMLHRARELLGKESRDKAEYTELRELEARLSALSPDLALDLTLELERAH